MRKLCILLSYASTLLVLHVSLSVAVAWVQYCAHLSLSSFCFCYAESLLLHHFSPSLIDVCLVLFCSALSSLLLLLLLHPVWAACTWGLLCFQLCLSLPLQELTLRSTFRSVRRRNDRGSIADTGWRRAEVWIRVKHNSPFYTDIRQKCRNEVPSLLHPFCLHSARQ